jgi:hypothetical protein
MKTRLSIGLAPFLLLSLCIGGPVRVGAAANPAFVALDSAC